MDQHPLLQCCRCLVTAGCRSCPWRTPRRWPRWAWARPRSGPRPRPRPGPAPAPGGWRPGWVEQAGACLQILACVTRYMASHLRVLSCNVMQTWSRPEQHLEQDKTLNWPTEQRQAASCHLIILLLARDDRGGRSIFCSCHTHSHTMPLHRRVSTLAITSHNLHAENTSPYSTRNWYNSTKIIFGLQWPNPG